MSVPLRSANRLATGFVVELGSQQDYPGPLSDVEALVSPIPVLRPEVWRLARAVADRAAGSVNDVLRLAIPTRQVRVEKAWLAAGEPAALPEVAVARDPRLRARRRRDGAGRGRRFALAVEPGVVRLPSGAWTGRWAVTLARAAARTVASGATAIMVVPDYRDQDQLAAALAELLPAEIGGTLGRAAAEPGSLPGAAARRRRPRWSSSARGRPCTRRPRSSASSRSGTTAIRCSASRSARTCTRVTRP